jgi:hypothetical protein
MTTRRGRWREGDLERHDKLVERSGDEARTRILGSRHRRHGVPVLMVVPHMLRGGDDGQGRDKRRAKQQNNSLTH